MRTAGDLTKYRSYLRDAYSYQDDGTRRCINEALRAEPQSSTTDHVLTDEEVSANIPRHPFRLAIYRQVSCSARGSNWTLCDHRVDLAAVSAVTQQISRYLFRVWGDRSAGLNSDGLFKSERAKQNLCGDLDTMREEDIHDSLFGHMCNRRENFASPWISFTTSVIWVVAKALRLMEDGHVDLKLAIVDTYDLPNGAYLFQADALLRAYNLEERMVYKNMARSMVLVWKDIQAPMAVVSLKQFLPDALTRGRVRPGYLTLQSFHFRGSDKQFAKAHGAKWKISTKASEKKKKKKKKPSRLLKASVIRKKIYAEQPVREFLLEALRHQAPKSHRDYLAGRTFWGKRFDTRLKDFRTSISPFQLNDFALLVERNVTCPGFRLPMLIFLFSTLTKQFYRDSLVEAVRDLDRRRRSLFTDIGLPPANETRRRPNHPRLQQMRHSRSDLFRSPRTRRVRDLAPGLQRGTRDSGQHSE